MPSKDYKVFTSSLKKVYGAPTLKACKSAFETFRQQWSQYPGAVGVWVRNFQHVEQLYDYGASIRKIMYTTKKGTLPNENALLKILYLRVKELDQKWSSGDVPNWSMVINQLLINEKFTERVNKYLIY